MKIFDKSINFLLIFHKLLIYYKLFFCAKQQNKKKELHCNQEPPMGVSKVFNEHRRSAVKDADRRRKNQKKIANFHQKAPRKTKKKNRKIATKNKKKSKYCEFLPQGTQKNQKKIESRA